MRTRYKPHMSIQKTYHDLTLSKASGIWRVSGYGDPFTETSATELYIKEQMRDSVDRKIEYRFRDMDHVKHFALPNEDPRGPSTLYAIDYCTGSDTGMRVSTQKPFLWLLRNYESAIFPSGVSSLEKVFNDKSIPSTLEISSDPFDTKFSLWYLVVDLYDMRRIIPSLIAMFKKRQLIKAALAGFDRDVTLRGIADAHLSVVFGLLPTIHDLQDFVRVCKTWSDIYDPMSKALKLKHTYHSVPLSLASYMHSGTKAFKCVVPGGLLPGTVSTVTELAEVRRTCLYRFVAQEAQGWLARLKQFSDAFGILDPAAVWDLIPFSFVVDWFINVGGWLHKSRLQLFPADVRVLDYCESFNLKRKSEMNLSWLSPMIGENWELDVVERKVLTIDSSIFVRRRLKPVIIRTSLPRFHNPLVTVGRTAIAASLIAQRVPRRGFLVTGTRN